MRQGLVGMAADVQRAFETADSVVAEVRKEPIPGKHCFLPTRRELYLFSMLEASETLTQRQNWGVRLLPLSAESRL